LLTDSQIERYSRQIILPRVGGVGQERLLAARIRILTEAPDLSPALNYLAGAGIGHIGVHCPDGPGRADIITAVGQLNPEVSSEPATAQDRGQPLLILAGNDRIIEAARRINHSAEFGQVIFARLGDPYLMAVLTSRPPCLACATPALLTPVRRGESAALVSIAVVTETIKLLLGALPEDSRLIQFSDYEMRSIRIDTAKRCTVCGAGRRRQN
jgi:hypothetical protein